MTRVVLRRAAAPTLKLSGASTTALRRLSGVEVVVRGRAQTGSEFAVSGFTVRSVDGQPALDGVLRRDGDSLVLVTPGGTVRLGNPPAPLTKLVGARIWITGPLETGPNPYGVIEPAAK
jgi:hypothetical protein